ncbi:CaiB/BaiF CoA-transferase family protein [Pseudonocardia sp. MH-G8]|uniref:CaiB/BaiF CoA transferase family protein n=1 Tax=Pseudonocardia sp. MH-G8 TaxID=1854588 RepID=UPI000BA0AA67|nr:CoA transferase [Pseudonocardia sp. MH-G8]OZM76872.1 succinyl-CoA--benzylsuccinate CoA-transferase [Pseudonocardia sp. MH-G8]
MTGALTGLRVLDLSGALGNYCAKLFAELGADVVLVEPPGGSALRAEPPFAGDVVHPDRGLTFGYVNTGKRGIVLDLDSPTGVETLRELARTADLVIESDRPGVAASRGLAWADLAALNPALVLTSITPFGQSGPYAAYEADDLLLVALGGFLSLSGYPDGPPVRPAGEQAVAAGNLFGAVASMMALTSAELTGQGQHVDVSVQESVVLALENAVQYYDLEQTVRGRSSGHAARAGSGVFGCADGHVYILAAGIGGNRFWPHFVGWMEDEGVAETGLLHGERWNEREYVVGTEAREIFNRIFGSFTAGRTKAELYAEAQRRRVPLCPVSTAADLVASRQLQHRGYLVEQTGFGALMPGAPYRLSATPWQTTGRAPLLGEHTTEVLAEIGVST